MNIDSPCVKKCYLDPENICVGCFRSIDEILQWARPDTTAEQKIQTLANCESRNQARKK